MTTQHLILYKDFDMTKPWSLIEFKVDFKGDKARIHDNSGMNSKNKISRFNKLSVVGGVYGETVNIYYSLTVNGYRVYFKSNYEINKTSYDKIE